MARGARLLLATDTDLRSGVFSGNWLLVVFGDRNVFTPFPVARTLVAGILGGFIAALSLNQACFIYGNPETAAGHEVVPPVPGHDKSS